MYIIIHTLNLKKVEMLKEFNKRKKSAFRDTDIVGIWSHDGKQKYTPEITTIGALRAEIGGGAANIHMWQTATGIVTTGAYQDWYVELGGVVYGTSQNHYLLEFTGSPDPLEWTWEYSTTDFDTPETVPANQPVITEIMDQTFNGSPGDNYNSRWRRVIQYDFTQGGGVAAGYWTGKAVHPTGAVITLYLNKTA
jgi:hypothetical protein